VKPKKLKDKAERTIATAIAKTPGLEIYSSSSVVIDQPIKLPSGKTKQKTTPDFLVLDLNEGRKKLLEVTQGGGTNKHKAAQLMVIEEGGLVNEYLVVTGNLAQEIANTPIPNRRQKLFEIFGW
jgi:hypothetical protein